MGPLPSGSIRSNLSTWAVNAHSLPALGHWMHDLLPNEDYDPHFHGQELETTYLDTPAFALRKARKKGQRYSTVRLRCYGPSVPGAADVYALSVKTGSTKFRVEVETPIAELIEARGLPYPAAYDLLPADLQARLAELAGDNPLVPVVTVCCRRYAVEDATDRYTLDVHVKTDTGLCLPYHVLEYKSTDPGRSPPGSLNALGLRPVKLSKFLWATEV
jgi:hypothetical protein